MSEKGVHTHVTMAIRSTPESLIVAGHLIETLMHMLRLGILFGNSVRTTRRDAPSFLYPV